MTATRDIGDGAGPIFPRRAILAAGLSALVAGGAVALAGLGAISQPERAQFQFSRGTAMATEEDVRLRGYLSKALADERLHVTILGHAGTAGDAAANLELSETRAQAIQAIALDLGLPSDRITASGLGGGAPLVQQAGEGDRAYQSRLARVEVALQVRR